ncbi:PREDICTED: transmembrane emp24 domain-containing protein 4-like [Elephantulus edwardii]|uniref:transmembrane emp24 domain-containing protein 4-like n=1 Tax=Elephantulus edwardii TaxID=28737 RepID=UPI0003F06082|nr:PREDICTED: transmembrane emp24 domain-containing protein 4-like [Elephantulus edwardii]
MGWPPTGPGLRNSQSQTNASLRGSGELRAGDSPPASLRAARGPTPPDGVQNVGAGQVSACCTIKAPKPDKDVVSALASRRQARRKGNYRTQMWDKPKEIFLPSTPGLGMHVEVKDPEGKVTLSRQYGSEGRFTFTSHTPRDHQICLRSNSTRMALFAGGRLRVHLDIQVGEHANNYPEIAAKDKLTRLQLRVRQLLDQVEQIQKEQDYQGNEQVKSSLQLTLFMHLYR